MAMCDLFQLLDQEKVSNDKNKEHSRKRTWHTEGSIKVSVDINEAHRAEALPIA
jgi:hypothetical protein